MSGDRCPTCKRPVNLTGTYNPETECGEHEGSLTCRLFARALTAEREAERLRKEVEAVRARWDADTVSEDDTDGRDTDALLRCIGIDLRAALAQGADR